MSRVLDEGSIRVTDSGGTRILSEQYTPLDIISFTGNIYLNPLRVGNVHQKPDITGNITLTRILIKEL